MRQAARPQGDSACGALCAGTSTRPRAPGCSTAPPIGERPRGHSELSPRAQQDGGSGRRRRCRGRVAELPRKTTRNAWPSGERRLRQRRLHGHSGQLGRLRVEGEGRRRRRPRLRAWLWSGGPGAAGRPGSPVGSEEAGSRAWAPGSVSGTTRGPFWGGGRVPTHHRVEEQGEAGGQEAQGRAPEHDVQDALPVAAPVGRAPYLGVQQVGEAERVHHDQRLWGGGAAGWALGGGGLCGPGAPAQAPPDARVPPLPAAPPPPAPRGPPVRRGSPPAPPRWRSHTCRTGRCPEAPQGRPPSGKTVAKKSENQVPRGPGLRPPGLGWAGRAGVAWGRPLWRASAGNASPSDAGTAARS